MHLQRFQAVEAVIDEDRCPLSSPRVKKVVGYCAVGMTRPQIAALLYRSIKTVDVQCGIFLAEMEARTVQEACAKAVAEGWLTFKYVAKKMVFVAFAIGMTAQAVDANLDNDQALRPVRIVRSVRVVRGRNDA